MTKTIENFLRYVKIDTQSSEESTTIPSTMKQHDLAGVLVSELETMGATEITYDREHCYVYATVPASAGCENAPVLGFIRPYGYIACGDGYQCEAPDRRAL